MRCCPATLRTTRRCGGSSNSSERQYGKARRVWLMDRGVPTEEVLEEMRAADPPVHYLVGTPQGRLTRLEKHLVARPLQEARPGVQSLPQPDLADWRRGFRFWIQQVIEGKGADQQKLARNGCSEDLGDFPGGDRGYHARRHVSPSHQAQEGRQRAPLLEHRGESPGRRRPCGAAAAAVPGRDQRFAGTGLAQVDRRPRGRSGGAAPPVAV